MSYRTQDREWTLCVADDGVGLPADAASLKPGLGTSLVEALAKQLDAKVATASAMPGTSVSVRGPIRSSVAASGLELAIP